jgi:hypothetical protein
VRGTVESEVAKGRGTVELEVEGTDAKAFSDGGRFFVTAEGRGVVAVAAVDGAVKLSSGGSSVQVDKGEISRVDRSGAAPSTPNEAIRRVLLAVEWPPGHETNRATLPLTGTAAPGSRVFVQGKPVEVGPAGGFRVEVPLRKGKQKIAVVSIDALGRRKTAESTVVLDESLPDVRVKKKLWQ